MSTSRIANRYAKALMELAIEEGSLDTVLKDLQYVSKVAKEKEFLALINSPIIDKKKKKSALSAIFESHVSPLSLRFLNWVTDRGREDALLDMIRAFESQYKEDKKITTLHLTTAVELDQTSVDKILHHLKQSIGEDRKYEIVTVIDPSILGGFILKYGDNLYDASLKHSLSEMRKALMEK